MKKKSENKAMRQVELAKKCERKLLQDMHRPMVVTNKKKQANKYACRSFAY